MSSLVFTAAGAAIGSAFGAPYLGAQIGYGIGGMLDPMVFGSSRKIEGPRLEDLAVQTSTYGKQIPITYGTVRIAGNVIWSRPIAEHAATSSVGGKGGGGGASRTDYSYTVSLAIAICEGPIDSVLRVWADARQLDFGQGNYRIYHGGEEQLPDPFIEAFEGAGGAPAYRGLAYVVIEDFPLADFGNRIPNFTFEVQKKLKLEDHAGQSVEEMIRAVTMIPGAGEFVYDDTVQYKMDGTDVAGEAVQEGFRSAINRQTPLEECNAIVALDQLQATLPNLEWVSVVVCWFGDSIDAGACTVRPGVEYREGLTEPDRWWVAGTDRWSAHVIGMDAGQLRYGGTPSDASLLRYLDAIRARGLKVMLYPMIFMDMPGKPWRGRLTGDAAAVAGFFTKAQGYNAFIQHYASLAAGHVDGFVIGSEMIGLTKVQDGSGIFPAVDALISLAGTVKATLGPSVTVTYAADWSEYHHTQGGWYNLDPLWACPHIDVVGIDAYFPLTDAAQREMGYGLEPIMQGWQSGEGWDFYYTDEHRSTTAPLAPEYAWKNIGWWWGNVHTNPDGSATPWVPQNKPIWFTEYGFPSVDGAANQPNVFYDPASSEGGFPRHARGLADFRAQRSALAATEAYWADSPMVPRRFAWTWDARPFPYWPDRSDIWKDGGAWRYGHWLNGKLGISGLSGIIADLCRRAGLEESAIDASRLSLPVDGFVIASAMTARQAIAQLQRAYPFDAVESAGQLKFVPRGQLPVVSIDAGELVPQGRGEDAPALRIIHAPENELPGRVSVEYLNRTLLYQSSVQHATREAAQSRAQQQERLSVVLADAQARSLAETLIDEAWAARTRYHFSLPVRYLWLEPGDVVTLTQGEATHRLRLTRISYGVPGLLACEGVAEDAAAYEPRSDAGEAVAPLPVQGHRGATRLELLDLPSLPGLTTAEPGLYAAACGIEAGWPGAALYRSAEGEDTLLAGLNVPAVIGRTLDTLPDGPWNIWDERANVTVSLLGDGTLSGVSQQAVLAGANAALIGEEIVQFREAEMLQPHRYRLSGLLRGRGGTEWAMHGHAPGECFVLLGPGLNHLPIASGAIGLMRSYKAVTLGTNPGEAADQAFTWLGNAMKPLAPAQFSATRLEDGGLALRWRRRVRSGGEWRDGVDAPLDEALERYRLEIRQDGVLLREVSGITQPAFTYTAAMQAEDAATGPLTLILQQESALLGAGYAATLNI